MARSTTHVSGLVKYRRSSRGRRISLAKFRNSERIARRIRYMYCHPNLGYSASLGVLSVSSFQEGRTCTGIYLFTLLYMMWPGVV